MSRVLASPLSQRELRALLVLGRVSNLPTVWSNCLAGWYLGGGGDGGWFLLLCLGASSLYIGGMFLNDAFDADFDRQYRKERPIPSGVISAGKVWGWGLGWLLAGLLLLSLFGGTTLWTALLLTTCIVLYDAIHKAITLSPVLMAGCRFLLYLLAASAGARGITGLTLWCALALAAYVIGLSYIARKESARGPVRFWPVLLLLAPVLLAGLVNAGAYLLPGLLCALLLLGWIVRCLRETFWSPTVSPGRTVSGLLAGICLVDLAALAGGSFPTAIAFVFMFLTAILAQRYIPAT